MFAEALERIVADAADRVEALRGIAALLRRDGGFRWVGVYDVDHANGLVVNLVWEGPGPPEFPTFPIGKGLTGTAIAERCTVNVGDVASDPRYLTALDSTRSEIIVPIFDAGRLQVIGTIDVESSEPHAFSAKVQAELEACAATIQPLWIGKL